MFVPTFLIVVSCTIFLAALIEAILLYFAYKDNQFFRAQLDLPLTTRDAAAVLRISPTTVRRMAKKGLIASRKVGKQYRFAPGYIRSLDTKKLSVRNPAPYPFIGGIPQFSKEDTDRLHARFGKPLGKPVDEVVPDKATEAVASGNSDSSPIGSIW